MRYVIMYQDPKDNDQWSTVWDDEKIMVFENENAAVNKAMEEAKDMPGLEFVIMESVKSVKVPVGQPLMKQLKRGMEELGV